MPKTTPEITSLNIIQKGFGYFPKHVFLTFISVVLLSMFFMHTNELSDDQLNYVAIADKIMNPQELVHWVPYRTFSFILAGLFQFTHDHIISFKWIYSITAFLYMLSMYWALSKFVPNRIISISASIASLIPHYTLGMTFWGFAGSSFILPRILFMPIVPIVLGGLFIWENKNKYFLLPSLAAIFGTLSFESFLLAAICFPYMGLRLIHNKSGIKLWLKLIVSCVITTAIAASILFLPKLYEPDFFTVLKPVYENIFAALFSQLSALSPASLVQLHWEAAYAACWWTLLPPQFSDIAFAIFDSFFIFILAIPGACILFKSNRYLFYQVMYIVGAIFICAYVYQGFRLIGWKMWNMHPHIWEEARCFKFIFFPLFLCSAIMLQRIWTKSGVKNWLIWFVILSISPLFVIRSIPLPLKESIHRLSIKIFSKTEYQGYVRKALKMPDYTWLEEVRELNQILHNIQENDVTVLSTLHELKKSQKTIVIAYNDKRVDWMQYQGQSLPKLPYWYTAYTEIRNTLASGNALTILDVAHKYQCNYIVTESPLSHAKLSTLYMGQRLFLYKIVN